MQIFTQHTQVIKTYHIYTNMKEREIEKERELRGTHTMEAHGVPTETLAEGGGGCGGGLLES